MAITNHRLTASRLWIVAVIGGVATLGPPAVAVAKPTLTAPSVAAQRETSTVSVSARGARHCRLSARSRGGRRQGVDLPGKFSYTVRLAISPDAATEEWTLRVRCPTARSASAPLTVEGNPLDPGRRLFSEAKFTKVSGRPPKGFVDPRRRQNGKGGPDSGVLKPPVGVGSAGEDDGGRAERAIQWAMDQLESESYQGLGLRFVADAYAGLTFPRSATILANVLGPREGDRPTLSAPRGALVWFTLGDFNRGRNDGHVGISLGDGRMISAQRKVQIDEIDTTPWWDTRYLGWTPPPEYWTGRPPPPAPPAVTPPPVVTPPQVVTPPVVTPPPVDAPPPVGRILTIDNRITNGMGMLQDNIPLELTTEPRTYCRRDGCTIANTARMSGDTYDSAVCQTIGVRYTNGNDRDPADDANPERVESTRYYGVRLASPAVFGYTSEVWVRASERGGLGLPVC